MKNSLLFLAIIVLASIGMGFKESPEAVVEPSIHDPQPGSANDDASRLSPDNELWTLRLQQVQDETEKLTNDATVRQLWDSNEAAIKASAQRIAELESKLVSATCACGPNCPCGQKAVAKPATTQTYYYQQPTYYSTGTCGPNGCAPARFGLFGRRR